MTKAKGSTMFPLSGLLLTVAQNLDFLKTPPTATIVVLVLSAGIGLVSGYINRRAVNLDDYKRMMIESQRVQKQVMAAMKSGNQRQIDKAQKRQQELATTQSKMTMDRLKSSLYTMIPILIIYSFIGGFFGNEIVAYFPFPAPYIPAEMSLPNWYFFSSIATSVVISRVLGLTFEIDPEESAVKEDGRS